MLFIKTLFSGFSVLDVIDIILVAAFIYYVYSLIRNTLAANIFIALIFIFLLWQLVGFFHLALFEKVLGGFMSVGVVALLIVFQQEIRRFLIHLGKGLTFQRSMMLSKVFGKEVQNNSIDNVFIKPVIEACKTMKKNRTGALIIFAKYFEEDLMELGGEMMDAHISKRLIESIFQKNSPMHDGAMIISEGKIKMASCILPVSDNHSLPAQLGLRHRAGVGISEQLDVLALIISEETGEISYARQGKVKMDLSWAEVEKILAKYV